MSPTTSRAQQKRLVSRLRAGLITSSVVSALGLAGYLGLSTQTAAAEPTDTTTTDTAVTGTGTETSTDSGTSSYFGDSPQVSSGSGSSDARTSGS